MGKGDKANRDKGKQASSARAAELLVNQTASAVLPAVGFGGFSGAQRVGSAAALAPLGGAERRGQQDGGDNGETAARAEPAQGGVDPQMWQHIRRLSKRDPITKQKALQALKGLAEGLSVEQLAAALPAWAHVYQRLVMDNQRLVRTEASGVLQAFTSRLGRGLAASLRLLVGPWWLAQFDPHSEAAKAARAAFQSAFIGQKQRDALIFTRTSVLDYLEETIKAAPETLGDVHKESGDEMAERHVRVLSQALLALASFLDLLIPLPEGAPASPAQPRAKGEVEEVLARVGQIVQGPEFLKRTLGSKAPDVRQAAYTLIATICQRAPQLLDGKLAAVAPLVLGAFGEKHSRAHGAMWDMILGFLRAHPSVWESVDAKKSILPRFNAFLRHACFGSAESSYPAVLLFLTLMPVRVVGGDSGALPQILESLWGGWEAAAGQLPARDAAAASFQECLRWGVVQAPALAPGDREGFARALMEGPLCSRVLPAALNAASSSCGSASDVIVALFKGFAQEGAPPWAATLFLESLGHSLAALLSGTPEEGVYDRATVLIRQLHAAVGGRAEEVVEKVARPVVAVVLPAVKGSATVPGATALLAALLEECGPGVQPTGGEGEALSVESAYKACLGGAESGPLAAAHVDMLLACLRGSSDANFEFGSLLQRLASEGERNNQYPPPMQNGVVSAGENNEHLPSTQNVLVSAGGGDEHLPPTQHVPPSADEHSQHPLQAGESDEHPPPRQNALASAGEDHEHLQLAHNDDLRQTQQDVDVDSDGDLVPVRRHIGMHKALTLGTALVERIARGDVAAWQSAMVDAAAQTLAARCVPDHAAAQFLGRLLSGDGQRSLLSDAAAERVLETLTEQLQQAAGEGARKQVLETLEEGLSAAALCNNEGEVRDASLRLIPALFCLAWAHMPSEGGGDEHDEESDDVSLVSSEEGFSDGGEPESNAVEGSVLARRVWAGGKWLSHLLARVTPGDRAYLEASLVQGLTLAVAAGNPALAVAAQAREALSLVGGSLMVGHVIVGALLTCPNPEPAKRRGNESRQDLATALYEALGPELVLLAGPSPAYRAWLARELLETEEGGNRRARRVAAALRDLLVTGTAHVSLASSQVSAETFKAFRASVMQGLWEKACADGELASAGALAALLRQMAEGPEGAEGSQAAGAEFFRRAVSTCGPCGPPVPVLDAVAVAVRGGGMSEEGSEAWGLTPSAEACLARVGQKRSLMQTLAAKPSEVEGCLRDLEIVLHCFPVEGLSVRHPRASAQERAGLQDLLNRELAGERRAEMAAAATARAGNASGDTAAPDEGLVRLCNAMLGQIAVRVLTYCPDVPRDDVMCLLGRARTAVDAAAVQVECFVEDVVAAAVSGASQLAVTAESLEPAAALRVLQSLGKRFQQGHAAGIIQGAASAAERVFVDGESDLHLEQAPAAWLLCLLFLMEQEDGEGTAGGEGASPDFVAVESEALGNTLRLLLSWGVGRAVACSAGPGPRRAAGDWADRCASLWRAAAGVVTRAAAPEAVLLLQREASGINTWGLETGVMAVDSLLALALEEGGGDLLHSTAANLLLSDSNLLSQVATPPPDEEDEEEEDGIRDSAYVLCKTLGVRWPLALALTEPERGRAFLLAWALLLAAIQSLPFDDAARHRLAQGLHAIDGLVPTLLDHLVGLLPLEKEQAGKKAARATVPLPPPAAAAAAAAEARARGEVVAEKGSVAVALKSLLGRGQPLEPAAVAVAVYSGVLRVLPASVRTWHTHLRSRGLAQSIEAYTTAKESGAIISSELATVTGTNFKGEEGIADFSVKAYPSRRQAVAVLAVDDGATLEMAVRLPPAWPLRPADVEVLSKVGVAEGRLRKWLLSITAYLRSQNGSLADAMALWRSNCAREFAGLEECLICYSIVAAANRELPRQCCNTCHKNFHGTCLYKWFKSAGKSTCPHCQSAW